MTPSSGAHGQGTKSLREELAEFVAYRRNHLVGDEKGEAQLFLDRLFRAFGHEGVIQAGGLCAHRRPARPFRPR